MKKQNRRSLHDDWESFEMEMSKERCGGKRKKTDQIPDYIIVQRLSTEPKGKIKKHEPLFAREFVPYGSEGYDDMTIENVKAACEKFFKAPSGTCDVLLGDRGPPCFRYDQIQAGNNAKKVHLVRFIKPLQIDDVKSCPAQSPRKVHVAPKLASPAYPKSVCVSQLLKAARLIKPIERDSVNLSLEYYDAQSAEWMSGSTFAFKVEVKHFAEGGFRRAYKAEMESTGDIYVVKRYKEDTVNTIKDVLKMSTEEHTRKQVQLHSVAANLTHTFASRTPKEYGKTFEYGSVYFAMYGSQPVTIESFVGGTFSKYVNNDGDCQVHQNDEIQVIFDKAQTLVHWTYEFSKGRLMLLDIQGVDYSLYDPEIASPRLTQDDSEELNFCAGNLGALAINKFIENHICNEHCDMLSLKVMTKISV